VCKARLGFYGKVGDGDDLPDSGNTRDPKSKGRKKLKEKEPSNQDVLLFSAET